MSSIRRGRCVCPWNGERNQNYWCSNCFSGRGVGNCREKKAVWNPAWQWFWRLRDTVHFSSAAKTYGTCFLRQRVLVKMSSLGSLSWLPSGQMTLKYGSGGGWLAMPFPFGEGVEMIFVWGRWLPHVVPPVSLTGHRKVTTLDMERAWKDSCHQFSTLTLLWSLIGAAALGVTLMLVTELDVGGGVTHPEGDRTWHSQA